MTDQIMLIEIEIRAAEIAASGSRGLRYWGEVDGWAASSGRHLTACRPCSTPQTFRELAGWLAYIIWSHRE